MDVDSPATSALRRVGLRSIERVAWVGWLLVSAACGASHNDSDGDNGATRQGDAGAPIAMSELPQALARAVCESLEPCCQQAQLPFEREACINGSASAYAASFAIADERRYTYDPERAGTCVRALREREPTCSSAMGLESESGLCGDA